MKATTRFGVAFATVACALSAVYAATATAETSPSANVDASSSASAQRAERERVWDAYWSGAWARPQRDMQSPATDGDTELADDTLEGGEEEGDLDFSGSIAQGQ
jgi:hypothetical protein